MPPIELTLPMPATQTNSARGRSRHWRAIEKEKTAYWELLDFQVAMKRIPAPPAVPIAAATLRSVMHLGGAMDDDNAAARHKWPIDWLRKRGYVAGDRRKNLRWEAFPEQVIKRDGNYRLVLTLTPTEEGIVKKATAGRSKANKPPKRTPAFKKAGNGIEAHGHVSELREHHDGSGVRLSIKHGKRKQGGDGIFDTYQDESSFTIPHEAAKEFTMGGRVKVRVHPHAEPPKAKKRSK